MEQNGAVRASGTDGAACGTGMVRWAGAGGATFDVRHHYRYAYPFPVADLRHRLMMVPPDWHFAGIRQELLAYRLTVAGPTNHLLTWRRDRFGNRVASVHAPSVVEAVEFTVTYRVRRTALFGSISALPDATLFTPAWRLFLRSTPLTAPDANLGAAAGALRATMSGAPSIEIAQAAERWTAQALRYAPGATDVTTTAAEAARLGQGVCQDYAHVLLCMLRVLGIPARYVSGHLIGEGAPHAWVEALVHDGDPAVSRVVTLDPTHHWLSRNRAASGGPILAQPDWTSDGPHALQYIAVAAGRDFSDVSPTSGTCRGPVPGAMTWSKSASVVEVTYPPAEVPV